MASSISSVTRHSALQRFLPMEQHEVGRRISRIARAGVQSMMIDPQFDVEAYRSDHVLPDRSSSSLYSRSIHFRSGVDPQRLQSAEVGSSQEDGKEEEKGEEQYWDSEKAQQQQEPPYHVFTHKQKWLLVWIIGFAGLFSGLSSNIYFPSLDLIAQDFHVDLALVSFTITSYLVIQGISPLIWGSFSDALGRRPIYIYSFSIYIIANIVLSFSPNFAVLLIFRGIQAAGSASTVSIGNGVIQDVTVASERGAFLSFYQAIRNLSIAAGPVLGGILASSFGFRATFVFLLILSVLTLIMIIIILPETMRSIAGDGTLRLSGIYRPLIWTVRKEPSYMVDPDERPELPKITWRTFVAPLTLLMNKSIVLSLIPGGIVYAIWSMVTASTVSLFKAKYQLNELLLGVAFIPNGLGTIVGSSIVGKLMNRDFIRTETEYKRSYNLPEYYELPKKDLPVDFPIERSRLRSIWGFMALFVFSTSIYGWTLAFPSFTAMPGSIALPLFFQFLIAASSNAVFAVNQTLIADLCPGKGASSTAINNLVRCTLGAIGVALIDQMIAATTVGPTFLGLGLISFICVPLLLIEWTSAMGWRVEEAARLTRDKVTIYYL